MCDPYKIEEKYCHNCFIVFDMIFFFILSIVHLVFYFYIKQTDFGNIFDAFESSPLFNFSVEKDCAGKSHITFHVWEGREKTSYYYYGGSLKTETKIVDVTNIDKINGYFFCYDHISYKDLLYNGQIKKECTGIYSKNCGIIDTLNQYLCIKENEKCPIYDVGIVTETPNNGESGINYSNEENEPNTNNKKIIGKVILNDGQPCYRLNEKLWQKFVSEEAGDEHLKCELEIFGKLTEERFKPQGQISYDRLYQDNLGSNYEDLFSKLKNKLSNNKVTLYVREFLGIDKECDEENKISKDDYETLSYNQNLEKIFSLVESLIFLVFVSILFISIIIKFFKTKKLGSLKSVLYIFLLIGLILILIFIICHAVFLGRIMHNDLSYKCSDDITNEISKKENENTKKSILYTTINLGLNIFTFLINILTMVIIYLIEKFGCFLFSNNNDNNRPSIMEKNFNPGEKEFKSDNINETNDREVVVNNRMPVQDNQYINRQNHNANLGVPPQIFGGESSNSKT